MPRSSSLYYRIAARTQSAEMRAGRLANGWTQDRVAEFLGVSKHAWLKWEYGKRLAPEEVREKLAGQWRLDRGKLGLEPETSCPCCGEPFSEG
jgi:transcriptional regulator with XRE-family HTH domain